MRRIVAVAVDDRHVAAATSLIDAGLYAEAEEFLLIGERDANGARVVAAEVLRLRGNVLAAAGQSGAAEAKLREALAVARLQGARVFELRAATDLAPLLKEHGKGREAAALLRPIYGFFTEGLDAPDLKRAAAVLASLPTI